MSWYNVVWESDIEAASPEEAAETAFQHVKALRGGVWTVQEHDIVADTRPRVPTHVDLENKTTDDVPWQDAGDTPPQ